MQIDDIAKDVKEIKTMLTGNGSKGYLERIRNLEYNYDELKSKPKNIKNYLVAIAIIVNTLVAAGALWRAI